MKLNIAVLPGDGIGPEVIAEAVRVLRAIAAVAGYDFRFQQYAIGAAAIRQAGSALPPATRDACLQSDAVLLGAVGAPQFDAPSAGVRPEDGLLALRRALGGFANLRPVVCRPSIAACSPLRPEIARGADILFVRELLGGIYFSEPRAFGADAAVNTMRYSAEEVERVARVAFEQASRRRRKVTSVDKANVLETSRLWRQVVSQVALDYPDVRLEHLYVDTCAMRLISQPGSFDVVLAENLFGDILTDEAAVIAGSLGLLASASLGGSVGLYEPVHGSAPDIAGRGLADPLGAIASAALLLRHSAGLEEEAHAIERAIDAVLAAGHRTAELRLPGEAPAVSTAEMGALVEEAACDCIDRERAYHAV